MKIEVIFEGDTQEIILKVMEIATKVVGHIFTSGADEGEIQGGIDGGYYKITYKKK